MVAPSFQSYKVIVAEPFTKNGKLYITVEHPNTKNHRDVRWYSEKEYRAAYGKSAPIVATPIKVTFYQPAGVKIENIESTPTNYTIHAKVAKSVEDPYVAIWLAYGAMLSKKEV